MNGKRLVLGGMLLAMAGPAEAEIRGGAFARSILGTIGLSPDAATSIAIGSDGLGLISYVEPATGTLKVAHCEDPACSWATLATIAGVAGAVDTAVTIGADGRALIAFRTSLSSLGVAHCTDVACASATVTTGVDGAWSAGSVSVALGKDGRGLISYTGLDLTLKVAHCNDVPCSGATIATLGPGIGGSSVVLGADGLGLIAYDDFGDLWVAHCNDVACSSATRSRLEIGSPGVPPPPPTLTIGADGFGLIAYTRSSLARVAHCQNVTCTTATLSDLPGSSGISLATGADGLGIMTVQFPGGVGVVQCENAACTSTGRVLLAPGGSSSLTIGRDGLPLVSYHDIDFETGSGSLATAHQVPRGDFNGDGRADLLWRHDGSGDNLVWLMNGVDLAVASPTAPLADAGWRIVGTHDFNDDAHADILWRHAGSGQNAVWLMNGLSLISGELTTPAALADTRWQMAGTGDFDRNGRPDILWRHDTSGEMVLWYMNGAVLASGTFLTPASLPDPGWKVGGTGDFSRDGRPDILWHHQGSGQVVVWHMNGSVLTSGTFTNPPAVPDTLWKVAAVGDYNADARPDIVWRHQASGQIVAWLMNGTTLTAGLFTQPSAFPAEWRIAGPR